MEARAALRCVSESFVFGFLTSDSFYLFDITPAPAEEISAQRCWQGRSMTLLFDFLFLKCIFVLRNIC
jgi:hypothetical protein